ncbi:MAG: MBL fold metallo-hydrolase [Gloeobacteraceae cyanobacterium ES-bin-316]|nr:MBL fold metallo-hydrolase [Ferruginibacter sp.]
MIACECEVCSSSDIKDKRLRSSILVQSANTTLVVDTTPDFRYQMLRAGVKKMDGIIYTHSHKDHIAGLDDVRAFNFFNHAAVNVYASSITQKALKNEFHYVFAEHKYPGIPDLILNDIDTELFMVGDIPIQPIRVLHLHMSVLGFRFGNFTYITDANSIEEAEKEKIRGSEIIVLNALRLKKHISHFTLQEAIAMADELEIPQAYFTHISHQLGTNEATSKIMPAHRALAYDMQQLHIRTHLPV